MPQPHGEMYQTFRSWLGAEPQLGIIVLAISVPIVGVLAYIVIASAPSAPLIFALVLALWAASVLASRILGRLNEDLRTRVERLFNWIFVACAVALMLRQLIEGWRDFGPAFVVKFVIFLAVTYGLIRFAAHRAENIDYTRR